jgi:hypothetical protein
MAQVDIYDISLYLEKTETGYADYLITGFFEELKELPIWKYRNVTNEFLDAIAHKEYETERLWWVLAKYNDIIDPTNPGTIVLKLPHLYDIDSLMLKYRK